MSCHLPFLTGLVGGLARPTTRPPRTNSTSTVPLSDCPRPSRTDIEYGHPLLAAGAWLGAVRVTCSGPVGGRAAAGRTRKGRRTHRGCGPLLMRAVHPLPALRSGSGRQCRQRLSSVLGAAVVRDLAITKAEVVMKVHRGFVTSAGHAEPEADERM